MAIHNTTFEVDFMNMEHRKQIEAYMLGEKYSMQFKSCEGNKMELIRKHHIVIAWMIATSAMLISLFFSEWMKAAAM